MNLRNGSLLLAALALLMSAVVARPAAAKSTACDGGGFKLVLDGRTYADRRVTIPAATAAGKTVLVQGYNITFALEADTFTVRDYALTGNPNPFDMTGGQRTVLFASKAPQLSTALTGDLTWSLDSRGDLVIDRGSGDIKMKIQAKDCAQGGIFQMEPSKDVIVTHTLAPGMFYFKNPYTGKINFGNGMTLKGKDSPQVATRVSQDDMVTVWTVTGGGRMGGVLGEDAVEGSPPATSCVQDCQAQNRVHGSVPVTDPYFNP